jgi:signal transduction histidine kinase
LLFSVLIIMADDYFFIPPIGSFFRSQASFDHFAVIGIVALVVNLLVYFLRTTFRSTIDAKVAMEKAKLDAERSAHAMEKLLAHVSHDVRNPLASVKLMSQLIARHPDQAEKNQQLANRIAEGLNRVDAMIQTLLDVSRMRAGQEIPLLFETCDLRKIVERTLEELSIDSSGPIQFSGEDSLVGTWSPEGIRRAVENLVSNARKYGDAERPIVVRVVRNRNEAVIAVHNEGKEISFSDQATLFDSYRRASTGARTRGWGLGLALVKGVAEAHDGSVEVTSAAGTGTTFTLLLPISLERRESGRREAAIV